MATTHRSWQCRLRKTVVFRGATTVETTPFVMHNRLYRLENAPKSKEFPFEIPQYRFHEDEIRVRDIEEDRIVSVVLRNHYFGSAFVWDGRLHIFAGDYGEDQPWWHIRRIVMISSNDLIHWTEPVTVIESENRERLFNTAVCRGENSFVLLYETDDTRWTPPFTFKYCTSDDLLNWTRIPDAIYGESKYVGGPALYYEGGFYYTLYLQDLGGAYETRITRSRNLLHWEDAPEGRPFLTPNLEHAPQPDLFPDVREISACDAKLCAWQGKTLVYFYGGNQQGQGALQLAEFDGSPRELLEHYFMEESTGS